MFGSTILTGIKNSGELHIGSYLGAIKPMIKLQQKYIDDNKMRMNMFIPDLHSLTVPTNYDQLMRFTVRNTKLYMACGFDLTDKNTFIYRQSRVPAHSELTVLLNNFTTFGELSRQTQFKDKQSKGESVSVGLFDYPVLMAADILLYNAKYIPVGEDQRQHLELTRDLAIRINNKFGEVFLVPDALEEQIKFMEVEKPLRIMSLSDPTKKMSKSVIDATGTINLIDSPSVARKKIMSATTDSLQQVGYDHDKQPGISNLLQIYASFKGLKIKDAEKEFKDVTHYGDFKKTVADVVCEFLADVQQNFESISDDVIFEYMTNDEAKVSPVANETLARLQTALGLR
ncbi:tryptophan--tRNA ligase [Candidatus Saccharibacteria bacterium]|nr:tryptophan--tRNA ligase [Candidatus Saccharibacteria bacterium]